ncbi:MAG: zf-HC2 domain-containing protein [Candidatus Aminicenantes bacterium]|nr:zf-HC2 domain-containing protein [Candidatus Aminicenantes bacterium]
MTCRRFKRHLILDLYEELSDRDRRRLRAHLDRCAACRADLQATRAALDEVGRTPAGPIAEPDWEKSWRAVERGLEPSRRRPRTAAWLPALPGWAYAAAGLAVLFVLGIAVGRYWLPTGPAPDAAFAAGEILSPAAIQGALGRHLDDVEPLLASYANNGSAAWGEDRIAIDRETAQSLLVQNFLLKRALARENPQLAELLEDLGLVLTEVANRRQEDPERPAGLKDVIDQRQVLSRVRRWAKI